jgi:cell division protein FtsL
MMSLSAVQVKRSAVDTHRSSLDSSYILLAMICLVFLSAFALIYVKYESQRLYMAYNSLKVLESKFTQEIDDLALENATLANNARVYSYAKETRMRVPAGKELVILP